MFRPLLAVLVEFNRKISVCYLAVEVSDMKYYFHRILRSVLGSVLGSVLYQVKASG